MTEIVGREVVPPERLGAARLTCTVPPLAGRAICQVCTEVCTARAWATFMTQVIRLFEPNRLS
jgi:hypothetical protein